MMSDLPNISPAELANLANQNAIANGFGDMQQNRGQTFLDPKIPIGCYDIQPNADLEKTAMTPGKLFPADLVECIVHKSNMFGIGPMAFLRQQVPYVLAYGKINDQPVDFDKLIPADAKELEKIKRKPADDKQEAQPIDQLIKMFLKDPSSWFQLSSRAKSAGVSNHGYLVLLVDAIVDGNETKRLLAESKEAMEQYELVRKKKFMFQDVLGHLG